MNAMALLGVFAAWLLGALITATLWPRDHSRRSDWTLILPLGLIIGLGTTSVIFFGVSLLSTRPAALAGAVELTACAVLITRLRAGARKHVGDAIPGERAAVVRRAPALVATSLVASIFVQAAVVAGIVTWREYQAEPLGGWDGWAIWNMHARFMLRAGEAWPDLLRAPQLSWSHPDYPPLLPAAVARLWSWAGEETPFAAALVGVAFAGATLAILVAVVAKRRNADIALTGGIVLLATPFFVTFAPNQHADIPLASFILAAVALSFLADGSPRTRGRWALAGLCAGCAVWTKNEGVLFALGFAGAIGVRIWRAALRPAAASFFGALAITLAGWLYFKLQLAPPNDLMSAALGPRIGHLVDPARHATILSSLWRDLGRFGEWSIAPWIALILPFAAWRARRPLDRAEWIAPAMLALMLAGYYGVYLLTPQALAWHLDTSLVRLLLQLWPLLILTWCLVLPDWIRPDWAAARSMPRVSRRALWVGANIIVAAGVVSVLSMQRGANELVVRRVGRAEVSAMVGEGWFALERHGRYEWAWSSGHATLPLHVKGPTAVGPLTMQFALRGVGSRTVTVRQGERILWEGSVGPQYVPVTISGMMLAPGTTTLEFSTDAPGIAESAAVGGRSLAFALYNLRLK
jgi:hypothetical protein